MKNLILCLIVIIAIALSACGNEDQKNASEAKDSLPKNPDGIRPLLIGDAIPEATLQTSEGKPFDLDSAVRAKRTIIIYYRGGWCFFCNHHLGQIHEIESQLYDLGYQLFAVSADLPEKTESTAERQDLGFRLLSDNDMETAKKFGIAYKLSDELYNMFREKLGADIEKASGRKHRILPVPAVFITEPRGNIVFEYINPNFRVRLHPDVMLAAARAYKNYNVEMK
jgi:peroxiredoxin